MGRSNFDPAHPHPPGILSKFSEEGCVPCALPTVGTGTDDYRSNRQCMICIKYTSRRPYNNSPSLSFSTPIIRLHADLELAASTRRDEYPTMMSWLFRLSLFLSFLFFWCFSVSFPQGGEISRCGSFYSQNTTSLLVMLNKGTF
jgi:hypothetical protein